MKQYKVAILGATGAVGREMMKVLAERDSVVAGAQKEAARIRSQAREEADQLLKDTNLKAEAIDQLAREQAIGQARKMVQAATEETREIQNAHRLRLQDLQSRIDAMEQQRAKLMDFLAKMIAELQETQDYAQQNTPQPPLFRRRLGVFGRVAVVGVCRIFRQHLKGIVVLRHF